MTNPVNDKPEDYKPALSGSRDFVAGQPVTDEDLKTSAEREKALEAARKENADKTEAARKANEAGVPTPPHEAPHEFKAPPISKR